MKTQTTSTVTLTINTGRLADLWLPAARLEMDAEALMAAECKKACRKAVSSGKATDLHRHHLLSNVATLAMCEVHRTINEITRRGGLLLIGGAA